MSPVQGMQYAFLEAAWGGDLNRVKDLIEQGCPVNAENLAGDVYVFNTYIQTCALCSSVCAHVYS